VLRPLVLTAVAGVVVLLLTLGEYDPLDLRTEYGLRAATFGLVLVGAVGWWWSLRRELSWGADLVPAAVGAVAALALAGSLRGTPYAPGGLAADQTFRTATITRYADTWRLVDFTFDGLPAFYAPAWFWVLGRAADLTGVEPWRMAKLGAVLTALVVPLVTYLLWRRLVPLAPAALVAVVPLLVAEFYQPYAWLVLFAVVPWWLETVHGVRRGGRAGGSPVFLGVIGAVLFLTYYYFFFIVAIALVIHLVAEQVRGALVWRRVGRAALALGIAAALSAVYWLPLAVSMLRAEHARSLANRWFAPGHPDLPLPMTQASVVGALALLGLVYLVWTAGRSALSRGLLVVLVAAYAWYLIGAVAAVADTPLLSFRGKPLVPLILVTGGVLGLARLGTLAATRFAAADVWRVAWVLGVALAVFAGQQFLTTVRDSPLIEVAHATPLPDGSLPSHAPADAVEDVPAPPAAPLRDVIDAAHAVPPRPVLLSDRADIMALYPYFGFLQWNAHYAHPASEFDQRVAWLESLAGAADPATLAAGARANPYDVIDVFVLRVEGEHAVLRFAGDDFPHGLRTREIRFPRELFADEHFEVVEAGDYLVAAPR
jgi:galactan 5-O-arabinofuranosyltransferase